MNAADSPVDLAPPGSDNADETNARNGDLTPPPGYSAEMDRALYEAKDENQRLTLVYEYADALVRSVATHAVAITADAERALKRHFVRAWLDTFPWFFVGNIDRETLAADLLDGEELEDYATRWSSEDWQSYRRQRLVRRATFALTAVLAVGAVVVAAMSISLSITEIGLGIIGLALSVGVMLAAWMLVERVVYLITEPHEYAVVGLIVATFTASAGATYWYADRELDSPAPSHATLLELARPVAGGAAIGPVVAIVVAAVLVALMSAARQFVRQSADPRRVDSLVVGALTKTLLTTARDETWTMLERKGAVLEQLEDAARAIERGLPRSVRTGDMETDEWLRSRSWQIASGVRGLKRLFCSPNRNTRALFEKKLAHFIVSVALGHWDELAVDDPREDEKQPTSKRILLTARTLAGGVSPLIVALILVQQEVLTGAMTAPVLLFTGSLAFIVVLGLIDPQSLQRLPTAKDLAGSFAAPSKRESSTP